MKIENYLKSHDATEINIGQSGAKVWEVEGQYVIKHVCKEKLENPENFETYKKEAYFYQKMAGREYLPEIMGIELKKDEIWICMKRYNMIESLQLDDPLLKKIAETLALVHTDHIPTFLLKEYKKKELLSDEVIQESFEGWCSVLAEHSGILEKGILNNIADNINNVILSFDSAKEVLCHGDFHRGNLLMDEDGNIRICDWQGVNVSNRAGDISFFISRTGGEGISLSEDKMLDFYVNAVYQRTGERISKGEIQRLSMGENLITSFVFWHQYLHGSERKRVQGIYDKMVLCHERLMS